MAVMFLEEAGPTPELTWNSGQSSAAGHTLEVFKKTEARSKASWPPLGCWCLALCSPVGIHGVLHREGAPGSGVQAAAGSSARTLRSHTPASAEEWAHGGWVGLSGGSASSPAGCEFALWLCTSLYMWHLGSAWC